MLALGSRMTLRHDLAGVLGACPRAAGDHGTGQQIDHAMHRRWQGTCHQPEGELDVR